MVSHDSLVEYCYRNDLSKYEKFILAPFKYIVENPGKRFRTTLLKAFNFWFKIPQNEMDKISLIIESYHNASLIIDDIQDNSVLRRGKPVAHSIFSKRVCILSAKYATFLVYEMCLKNNPKFLQITTKQMLELHRGQGLDIYWRDNKICPTEEEYCRMTKQKTGGLFVLALKLMQLYSKYDNKFTNIVENISLYFQIKDDYINLTSDKYMKEKSSYDDISEGKFSFVIIHAVKVMPKILNILAKHPKTEQEKIECVELIVQCGSLEYTRKKLISLEKEILKELKYVDPDFQLNAYMKAVIETLFDLE